MVLERTRRQFSVDDYHAMAQAGILGEDDRVELIGGEILDMAPIGDEHAGSVAGIGDHFWQSFGRESIVWVQNPLRLGRHDEPQPDVALLRRRPDFYRAGGPTASDVLLVVEVADSSLADDRAIKVPLYARHGIPEVWLVDLPHRLVHVFRDPTSERYGLELTLAPGERIAPFAFPDRALAVADLLG